MLKVRYCDDTLSAPIPTSIAERLGIRAGDRLIASIDGDRIVYERVSPDLTLSPELREALWRLIHRYEPVLDRLAAADAGVGEEGMA